MKTNKEKGKLSIEMNCNNQTVVVFQPKDGAVWMNRNELCELFSVYQKTIDTIFKTRSFRVEEVCQYHQYVKGNTICYDITEVNLEVIITLAFQIDTPQAIVVRKWFVERCLKSKQFDFPFVGMEQNYAWN